MLFIVTNKQEEVAQVYRRPNQVIDYLANHKGSRAWVLELADDGIPRMGKQAKLSAGKTIAEIQEYGLMVGNDNAGTHNVNRPVGQEPDIE